MNDNIWKLATVDFTKSSSRSFEQHTAPQHRQYLSFDGVGYGSPVQREKQYQQSRASKAYGKVCDTKLNLEKLF